MRQATEDDSGSLRARRCIDAVIAHREGDEAGTPRSLRWMRHAAVTGALLVAVGAAMWVIRVAVHPESEQLPQHAEGSHRYLQQENLMMSKNSTRAVSSTVVALGVIAAGGLVDDGCAQSAVEWRVADGGNGHWYQLVISGAITWPNARSACEVRGGHLATPTTAAEEAWTVGIGNRADHPDAWVNDFGGNAGGPWLGGFQPSDATAEQPWAWVTGEPWNWTGWAAGEPNGGFGPGISVTVQLGYAGSNYYRGWADAGLTDYPPYPLPLSYIIEWSADCNADGIVDYGQIRAGDLADANTNNIPDCCEQGVSCDPCSGDIDSSGFVNSVDLAMILTVWGTSGGSYPSADIDHDGIVAGADLGIMLTMWGNCP